jgi:hypothetical protein
MKAIEHGCLRAVPSIINKNNSYSASREVKYLQGVAII